MTNRSNRFLALALAAFATLASEVAAQAIVAPASSSDTAVRASVGIDLSNYATLGQLSGLDGKLTIVQNTANAAQNTANTAQNTANTASQSGRPWPKAFPGQSRNAFTGIEGFVTINHDGLVAIYYRNYLGNLFQIGGGKYTGGGNTIVWSYQELQNAWASNISNLWNMGNWGAVYVYPTGWDQNGNPTNFSMEVAIISLDNNPP